MKVLLVCGVFDDSNPRPSGYMNKFKKSLDEHFCDITMINGGKFSDLPEIIQTVKDYDIVFWFVDVDNSNEKIRNVKEINPKCMLVTTKRNDNGKYEFKELINRALLQKSNLVCEFRKDHDGIIHMRVFDPLGVIWCDFASDIQTGVNALCERLLFLTTVKRQGTIGINEEKEVPDNPEFYKLIRDYAEIFHNLINPAEGVQRFLGNASFRCSRGFPSFRHGDIIYVSKRNVNKKYIDKEGFIATYMDENENIYYYGQNKPSVDTPIQLRLYKILPDVNYMLHAHVYIKDAPFTKTPIPCGGLEEVEEIMKALKKIGKTSNISINLIGHGSIILAKDLSYMKDINYIQRPIPEILDKTK